MDEELNRILKNVSRTIYLSIRVLPSGIRDLFSLGYLFCRAADSIADTRLLPCAERLKWVRDFPRFLTEPSFRTELAALILAIDSPQLKHERELIFSLPSCFAAFDKLPPSQQELICKVVGEVCLGMQMDLSTFPDEGKGEISAFATSAELEKYCALIGGAPGVFWTLAGELGGVFKSKNPPVDAGKNIGEALQLANILRDISADLRIGRCYLPSEDLSAVGLSPRDLLNANAGAIRPIIAKWIKIAVGKLDCAQEYVPAISKLKPGFRASVVWPIYWCLDTFSEIARAGNLLRKGAKISHGKIYSAIACAPAFAVSDAAFLRGYLRRRTNLLRNLSLG
ncbi:MAG: squalene/phytoene synthase family protein [Elusimicrobia bacterium]|nr:squalene/phytoene synthase family protein [Elusimicrobiota bacterium]